MKQKWLYDSNSGHTVHWFMYGYKPTTIGITRETLRIAAKKCGNIGAVLYRYDVPKNNPSILDNTREYECLKNKEIPVTRIRIPNRYAKLNESLE